MASIKRKRPIKRINSSKEEKNYNPYIQLGLMIIIAVIVIVSFISKKSTENYKQIKLDKNAYLIYTKYEDKKTKYTKEIPFVNLKADVFEQVNKDIITFCNDYINKEKAVITYEYDINGIILSLVIKAIDNSETSPVPRFRSYNINLNTEEVIAPAALLDFYKIKTSSVQTKIKRQLEDYYSDILKDNYYTTVECSFECFLKHRGITNYITDLDYYIRDGELIAFKSFTAHSVFGEESYFNDKSFEFKLALAPPYINN